MQSSEDLGNTFARSWQLLTGNWIIIVPGIVVAILAAIAMMLLGMFGFASAVGFGAMGMGGASVGAALLSAAIVGIISLIAAIITFAYTTGMAGAAWRTGKATLDDGAAAFRTDGAAILTACVLLFIIGIIAVVLAPFTFALSILAFWIFFLYTFASAVVGQRPGAEALGESARLAARNFLITLAVVILLAIAFVIASWLDRTLSNILPFLGHIVGYIIEQIVFAYATLVIVGEYIKLRSSVGPVGVGTPPSASSP